MNDNRPKSIFKNFVIFAADKEELKWWCIGRSIDYTDFLCLEAGQPKAKLKEKLETLDTFDVIILKKWFPKETVDFEICDWILNHARYVFTAVNTHPIVENSKIVDWSYPKIPIANRGRYFFSFSQGEEA